MLDEAGGGGGPPGVAQGPIHSRGSDTALSSLYGNANLKHYGSFNTVAQEMGSRQAREAGVPPGKWWKDVVLRLDAWGRGGVGPGQNPITYTMVAAKEKVFKLAVPDHTPWLRRIKVNRILVRGSIEIKFEYRRRLGLRGGSGGEGPLPSERTNHDRVTGTGNDNQSDKL